MATAAQTAANQENSKLSTGPKSDAGKQAIGENRVTHGILSNRLLSHENPDDYQQLLDGLITDLRPVGILEMGLVEKLTVILWRQRRLVRAETAKLEIEQSEKSVLSEINKALGYSDYGSNSLSADDLKAVDHEQVEWCQEVIAEIDSDADRSSVSAMKNTMPLCYGQLGSEAKEDESTPAQYFQYQCELGYGGIGSWVSDLKTWCNRQIQKADDFDKAQALIPTVLDKLSVIPASQVITFNKYQGSLDNQLFKTMKALREQQEYRLRTIDSVPVE